MFRARIIIRDTNEQLTEEDEADVDAGFFSSLPAEVAKVVVGADESVVLEV